VDHLGPALLFSFALASFDLVTMAPMMRRLGSRTAAAVFRRRLGGKRERRGHHLRDMSAVVGPRLEPDGAYMWMAERVGKLKHLERFTDSITNAEDSDKTKGNTLSSGSG